MQAGDWSQADARAVADNSAPAEKPDGVAAGDSPATRTLADMERALREARAAEKAARTAGDLPSAKAHRGEVWTFEKQIKAYCRETGEVSEALDEWKREKRAARG